MKKFNIKSVLRSQVVPKEHHVRISTKNCYLNHYALGGSIENRFSFIKKLMT